MISLICGIQKIKKLVIQHKRSRQRDREKKKSGYQWWGITGVRELEVQTTEYCLTIVRQA